MSSASTIMRSLALVLIGLLAFQPPLFAGLNKKKARYIGGTVNGIAEATEGKLNADDEKILNFIPDKSSGPIWSIPYERVTSLAYGQHAGRRVGATIAWGVTTLGLGALPILFSKKRRHYLTIEYTDNEGTAQAAIFELGKDITRTMLKVLEVRTGKKVEFEDEEARKAGNK
ncbi:MAG TPA: hypothetical protein VNJ09_06650 [Chthonomonadales bacterium]|jgi:hypothetical protein|nr:hypothetical protein [Chthonomonadales bacterium]